MVVLLLYHFALLTFPGYHAQMETVHLFTDNSRDMHITLRISPIHTADMPLSSPFYGRYYYGEKSEIGI